MPREGCGVASVLPIVIQRCNNYLNCFRLLTLDLWEDFHASHLMTPYEKTKLKNYILGSPVITS